MIRAVKGFRERSLLAIPNTLVVMQAVCPQEVFGMSPRKRQGRSQSPSTQVRGILEWPFGARKAAFAFADRPPAIASAGGLRLAGGWPGPQSHGSAGLRGMSVPGPGARRPAWCLLSAFAPLQEQGVSHSLGTRRPPAMHVQSPEFFARAYVGRGRAGDGGEWGEIGTVV